MTSTFLENSQCSNVIDNITNILKKISNNTVALVKLIEGSVQGEGTEGESFFNEEERSKQPSLFSIIREFCAIFNSPEAGQLGLYGAFGYDLTFQFEPIHLKKPRAADQPDIVLFLPDEILVVDNQKKDA